MDYIRIAIDQSLGTNNTDSELIKFMGFTGNWDSVKFQENKSTSIRMEEILMNKLNHNR